jgi:hypothetical protein
MSRIGRVLNALINLISLPDARAAGLKSAEDYRKAREAAAGMKGAEFKLERYTTAGDRYRCQAVNVVTSPFTGERKKLQCDHEAGHTGPHQAIEYLDVAVSVEVGPGP